MNDATEFRRAIIVVLDGLRPDAIRRYALPHLTSIMARAASTLTATTVAPSITNAAMASLLTGVGPATHGIRTDGLLYPRFNPSVLPLPMLLANAGYPSSAFMADIPPIFRALASRLGRRLGLGRLRSVGRSAWEVVESAADAFRQQYRGLVLLHFPDADVAGHKHGWMSPEYEAAARRLDVSLRFATDMAELDNDQSTLLIVLADHGGGGVVATDHGERHVLNSTIFLSLWSAGLRPASLGPATLLDVPPTVLWALGLEPPPVYEGRLLEEAFGEPAHVTSAVA